MKILGRLLSSVWNALFTAFIMWIVIAVVLFFILFILQLVFDFKLEDYVWKYYGDYGFQTLYIINVISYFIFKTSIDDIDWKETVSKEKLKSFRNPFRKRKIIEEG